MTTVNGEVLRRLSDDLELGWGDDESAVAARRVVEDIELLEPLGRCETGDVGPGRVFGIDRRHVFAPERDNPFRAFITRLDAGLDNGGPLTGIRVGLKDSIAMAEVPLTLGTSLLRHYRPEFDATVTQRLLLAGARIVGKLNMNGFASGDADCGFGRVDNPVAMGHEVGGSSSGCAAALAGGLIDAALGGDQGGSARIPAAWTGTVGFKPSFGRVPHTGVVGADPSLDHVGPMARDVTTVARVLDAIAGPDEYDARTSGVAPLAPGALEAVELPRRGWQGFTIVTVEEASAAGDDPRIAQCVAAATQSFRQAGAVITSRSIPSHRLAARIWLAMWLEGSWYMAHTGLGGAFSTSWYPESLVRAMSDAASGGRHRFPDNYRQMLWAGAYLHRSHGGAHYAHAQHLRLRLRRDYANALAPSHLLITPTVRALPPRVRTGTDPRESLWNVLTPSGDGVSMDQFVGNTCAHNLTGFPALTVPCGFVDGLPVGCQIVGRPGDDVLVLQAGRYLEDALQLEAHPIGRPAPRPKS
jgi:amidase